MQVKDFLFKYNLGKVEDYVAVTDTKKIDKMVYDLDIFIYILEKKKLPSQKNIIRYATIKRGTKAYKSYKIEPEYFKF